MDRNSMEQSIVRRVAWRLVPLLMLAYFCAYLDRSNIGMAALTMNKQLGFSSAMYGFGAGLFSLGYIVGRQGNYFTQPSFRLTYGAGKIGSLRIEPALFFNNFFKGVTPGLRVSIGVF